MPRSAPVNGVEEVVLSWPDREGVTKQELRSIFSQWGETRFERQVKAMRAAGNVMEVWEERPNRGGWISRQVVFQRRDMPGA